MTKIIVNLNTRQCNSKVCFNPSNNVCFSVINFEQNQITLSQILNFIIFIKLLIKPRNFCLRSTPQSDFDKI